MSWLMLAVVTGVRGSVFAAFQADQASDSPSITATASALYAKYGRIDPRYRKLAESPHALAVG
jgi:hypothetical protein